MYYERISETDNGFDTDSKHIGLYISNLIHIKITVLPYQS